MARQIRNKNYRHHLLDKNLVFLCTQDLSFTKDEFLYRSHNELLEDMVKIYRHFLTTGITYNVLQLVKRILLRNFA